MEATWQSIVSQIIRLSGEKGLNFEVMGCSLTDRSEIKYILAALYTNYTTSVVDDMGIKQVDAYTAPPESEKLMIKLQRLRCE